MPIGTTRGIFANDGTTLAAVGRASPGQRQLSGTRQPRRRGDRHSSHQDRLSRCPAQLPAHAGDDDECRTDRQRHHGAVPAARLHVQAVGWQRASIARASGSRCTRSRKRTACFTAEAQTRSIGSPERLSHELLLKPTDQDRRGSPQALDRTGLGSWPRRSVSWSRFSACWQFAGDRSVAAVFQPPDPCRRQAVRTAQPAHHLPAHFRHAVGDRHWLCTGGGLRAVARIYSRALAVSLCRAAALHHRPLQHSQDRACAGLHRLARIGHGIEGCGRIPGELLSRVLQYLFRSSCDQRRIGPAGAPDGGDLAADRRRA